MHRKHSPTQRAATGVFVPSTGSGYANLSGSPIAAERL
jgi:hypothetical protein